MKTLDEIREAAFALCHPIFRECCGDDRGRFSLSAPFKHGVWAVATNQAILVYQAASEALIDLLAECEPRKLPNLRRTFQGLNILTKPVPIPELPPKISCDYCMGLYQLNRVSVGPFDIHSKYAELLKRFNAKLFLPEREVLDPLAFTISGGVYGFLMPLVKEDA